MACPWETLPLCLNVKRKRLCSVRRETPCPCPPVNGWRKRRRLMHRLPKAVGGVQECWRRLSRVPWTKEIQPVHPKGDQSWVFIGSADAEAETPILWPPHARSWLIWKDPDAGKDWRLDENGTTEDGMVGWHHWLNGHEFEWTPGVGDGQGGLACCNSWGCKESDTTERLNWTN